MNEWSTLNQILKAMKLRKKVVQVSKRTLNKKMIKFSRKIYLLSNIQQLKIYK